MADRSCTDGYAERLGCCLDGCDNFFGVRRVHGDFNRLETAFGSGLDAGFLCALGNVAENAHDRHRF